MKLRTLLQYRPCKLPEDLGYARLIWDELRLLYFGGYAMQSKAAEFLFRMEEEKTEKAHEQRVKLASYINYFGPIVDWYVSALFERRVSVSPANQETFKALREEDQNIYRDFFNDADLKGQALDTVLRQTVTNALVYKKGIVGIDFPVADVAPRSLAEEYALGTSRPYIYDIDPRTMIDWEVDRSVSVEKRFNVDDEREGRVVYRRCTYKWVMLHWCESTREDITDDRSTTVHVFKYWSIVNGRAVWRLFKSDPVSSDAHIGEADLDMDVAEVDSGISPFSQIPIVAMEVPPNLWLGNLIGPLNLEHYRRRSAIVANQSKALFEALAFFLGPEIGAVHGPMPAARAANPARADDAVSRMKADGQIVLGKDDSVKSVGLSGKASQAASEDLDKLVQEIYSIVSRSGASMFASATAIGRSGASKERDYDSTAIFLRAIGLVATDAVESFMSMISAARGDDVLWQVHGLDSFRLDNASATLEDYLSLKTADIPSPTLLGEVAKQVARTMLPNAPPEVMSQIDDEIRENMIEEPGEIEEDDEDENDGGEEPSAGAGGDAEAKADDADEEGMSDGESEDQD